MPAPPADILVSVVAAVHGPPNALGAFLQQLQQALNGRYAQYEIVLVEDGTNVTLTAELQRLVDQQPSLRSLRLSRSFGQETAILAGLDLANGDYVVTLNPTTDPPALIPDFVEIARTGADVVLGVRRARTGDAWWLRLGSRLFYALLPQLGLASLPKNTTNFRCLSRQALDALLSLRDEGGKLRTFASYIGFRARTIEYAFLPGSSEKKSMAEATELAIALVVDLSPNPLRLFTLLALLALALNLVVLAVALASIFNHPPEPWSTRALVVYVSVTLTLLSAAIAATCEAVGRIIGRSRNRPAYYVAEERGSSVLAGEEHRNILSE